MTYCKIALSIGLPLILMATVSALTLTTLQQEVINSWPDGGFQRWAAVSNSDANGRAYIYGEIRADMIGDSLYPCCDWNMPDPNYYFYWYGKGEYHACLRRMAEVVQIWMECN